MKPVCSDATGCGDPAERPQFPSSCNQTGSSPHLPNICCFACYCFDQLYGEETPESPFHLHFGLLMFLQGFCISSVNYVNHPLPVFVHWSVPLIVKGLADLKGQLQMGAHCRFLPALLTLLLLLSHPPELSFALQGTFVIQTGPCFPGPWESHLSPPSPPFLLCPRSPTFLQLSPPLSTPCTSSLEILLGGCKPQGTRIHLERESHPTLLRAEKRKKKGGERFKGAAWSAGHNLG